MTAEIAIMNRGSIALAADSALTISGGRQRKERVWKTTNKIFSLSPENDIAIMIYASDNFCGVPWETIIKMFSHNITNQFKTVSECKDNFLDFVTNFKINDERLEELNCQAQILSTIEALFFDQDKHRTKTEKKLYTSKEISDWMSIFDDYDIWDEQITKIEFVGIFKELIEEIIEDKAEFHVDKKLKNRIYDVGFEAYRRNSTSGLETGIVFAGFGSEEYMPCLSSIIVDGKTKSGLRYWDESKETTMEYWVNHSSKIKPFAQADVAQLFIEGIDTSFISFLVKTIRATLQKKSRDIIKNYVIEEEQIVEREIQNRENDAAIKSLMSDFRKLRKKKIVDPILSVVSNLPKEEMAAMAEAMVEITSLRRRMDSDIESVAGPVDVVVLSKGDGLIWIKRKYYFESNLNPSFDERKSMRRTKDA